jgi:hypothetical protein
VGSPPPIHFKTHLSPLLAMNIIIDVGKYAFVEQMRLERAEKKDPRYVIARVCYMTRSVELLALVCMPMAVHVTVLQLLLGSPAQGENFYVEEHVFASQRVIEAQIDGLISH